MKKGISLIVLSITILVMAILAATVIISLEDSGIIGRSKKAVNSSNFADEYTRLTVIKNGILTDNLGTITVDEYIQELKAKGIIEDAVIDNTDGTKTITTKSGFEVVIGQSQSSDLNIALKDGNNVNNNNNQPVTKVVNATFTDGTTLSWEELKVASNGSKYGYNASGISDTYIDYSAFEGCTTLASIVVPSGVTIIDGSFSGCTSLVSVTLPNTLVEICGGTFNSCTSLETIILPNSVKIVGNMAFAFCPKLKSVTLSNTLEELGNEVFFNCTSLEHIVLPSSLEFIPMATFDGCKALKTIVIPVSVTGIGGDAFYDCTALTDVYYTGTNTQWNKINFIVGKSDPTVYGATLHCNYAG